MKTDPMSNKPCVLVTGSDGSMASWMIKKMLNNYVIVGIDNCNRYGDHGGSRNYHFEKGDLCDASWVNSVFEKYKPDYVIHAAAQIYGVVGFHKYSADILGSNSTSSHSVFQACAQHQVKKVAYISSSMVYERSVQTPFAETQTQDLPCPSTGYGFSKLYGERLLQEYGSQYGLDWVIWRPFNVVTPLETFEKEFGIAHVIPDMIKKIAVDQCESVEIFGDGNQVRCFTWIDDVADLVVNWSWRSETSQEIYNIGGEEPTRIVDLARMVWERSGRSKDFVCHFVTSYQDDVIIRIPDSSKIRSLTGWKHSKTTLEMIDSCLKDIGHGSV